MFVFTICFEEKCDDLIEYYLLFSNLVFDSAILFIASKYTKQSSSGEQTMSRAHPEGNLPEPGELWDHPDPLPLVLQMGLASEILKSCSMALH